MSGTASISTGTGLSQILLDTDVLIDHLRGHRQLHLSDPKLKISIVTRCELFAGRNVDEAALRRTLHVLNEVPVDRAIAEAAGRIRRTSGIPVPDALIAATALDQELELMTRNRRHFERVPDLILRPPPDQGELSPGVQPSAH
jgi:predicted nucleic acid-binding protein